MFNGKLNLSAFLSAKARSYLLLLPLSAAVGAAISLYRNSDLASTFHSSGRLVLSGRLNFSEGNPVANDFMSVLGTQLEVLTSEELRERAMIKLRLERPEATVRPELTARLVPRTTIFELSASSASATHVQRYLDLVMEDYVTMRREQRLVSSRSVMDQISGEITRLEGILNAQEAEVFRFKQQRNIIFWEQQSSTAARFLSQLKNREASLRMQLRLAELLERGNGGESLASRVGTLEMAETAATRVRPPAAGGTLAAQKLRLRELEIELEALALTFRPRHPKYQRLEGEIAKLRRLVALLASEDAAAFKAEVAALRSELETILASMEEWEKKVLESGQVEAEHQKLQSSVTRTRELYQRLVGSLQNIDFRKGVDDEVIQVLKRAEVAHESRPDAAKPLRNGIVTGLLGGVGLLLLAIKLDRRAFAVAEVTDTLGLEVAVEVPLLRRRITMEPVMASPKCPAHFAEAFRSLRAVVAMENPSNGGGSLIVVCSSTPAEGKSTVSLNLAYTAAKAGLRVLVIDADVRRGTIGRRMGLAHGTRGFSDLVRGEGSWRDVVQPVAAHGFAVIPCGSDSVAVVDSMAFKVPPMLLTETKREYDLVIIDSAPIIPVSDTVPLLARADRVVFVVRLRSALLSTIGKALHVVKRSASKAPLLVINGTRPSDGNYDYYDYSAYRSHPPR